MGKELLTEKEKKLISNARVSRVRWLMVVFLVSILLYMVGMILVTENGLRSVVRMMAMGYVFALFGFGIGNIVTGRNWLKIVDKLMV
jgi:hypothetical protein